MKNKKLALTVMEILIFFSVLAVLIPIMFQVMNIIKNRSETKITEQRMDLIYSAIRNIYIQNLFYILNEVENKKANGLNDPNLKKISLTPVPKTKKINSNNPENFDDSFYIYTYSESNLGPFKMAGCSVKNLENTKYEVRCYNGFSNRNSLKFKIINYHEPGKMYLDPYKGEYFSIIISSKYKNTNIYFTKKYYLNDLINNSLYQTTNKEIILANLIKDFTVRTKLKEFANDCTGGETPSNPNGGLGSWDDTMIPWVWEVVSSEPKLCSDSSVDKNFHCSCADFNSNNWNTDSNYCKIDTVNEWNVIFNNILLSPKYSVDGFGNPFVFVPLADKNGDPIMFNGSCVPPKPEKNYWYSNKVAKSRIGVYDSKNDKWYAVLEFSSQ